MVGVGNIDDKTFVKNFSLAHKLVIERHCSLPMSSALQTVIILKVGFFYVVNEKGKYQGVSDHTGGSSARVKSPKVD